MQDIPPANFEAFTQRLGAMRPKLHRYCARMTGSVVDGEDVVQEAMIKAVDAFPQELDIANVDAWVFRIAHNCALDLLRRRARQEAWISDEPADEIADPHADVEFRLAAEASLRTFMQLPPAQRAAVILMDVLGYSLHEISTVLDASVASIKASLHRGRARLREFAAAPMDVAPPMLDATDLKQLSAYVESFGAHDFDAIRALLAEDVRLDLVNRSRIAGRPGVGRYFGNYAKRDDLRFEIVLLDGRPVIAAHEQAGPPSYFIVIEWRGSEVVRILDFRYCRDVMEAAEITALPS